MWVEFVVSSRPCSKGFTPGSPVFLPAQKPVNISKFQFDPETMDEERHCGRATEVPISFICYC